MWLTTAEIKALLDITTTDYDAQIDTYNPIAQDSVERYICPTVINEDEGETLPVGYTPHYARLVWLMLNEGSTSISTNKVKSQSMDGESITYADKKGTDIQETSDAQLKKFLPLRRSYQ
ncbi:MAG: hypothetical protein WBA93_23600 [Microcoleaceae cyanobacterium]